MEIIIKTSEQKEKPKDPVSVFLSMYPIKVLPDKPLLTIEEWLKFNRTHPKIGVKRLSCNCCKRMWSEDYTKHVWVVFTHKKNKAVCDECVVKLREKLDAMTKYSED